MKDQMTVGRTVRLKHNKLIPGIGSEHIVIPEGGLYKILKVNNDDTIQVQGVQLSDKPTAFGRHIWPISDFELVDEV